ncbi:MAG: prolyl oligopeptidase family serine peptidase [Anaerolineae bacterium]|nr:prolyl oligopeptidase family serine peptidase [Anaerolineae bacterium]
MGRKIGLCGMLAVVIMFAWGRADVFAQAGQDSLAHDGQERGYYLYVPSSYDETQAVPLLVVLHPFASSGRAMAALTGFDAVAEQRGWIAVYPDSLGMYWDDGRITTGWLPEAGPVDDVGYIAALIDHLASAYHIDTSRVYLAGFASGGTLAFRLACGMPDRFAGVAVAGALLWQYHVETCPSPSAPVSVLMLIGSDDPNYPLWGRTVTQRTDDGTTTLQVFGADQMVTYWTGRNGCNTTRLTSLNDSRTRLYDVCDGGVTVGYAIIEGAGSNWLRAGGHTLNQFGVDTSQVMAEFFAGEESWVEHVTPTTARADIFGGMPRSYTLYVPPSYDPAQPMPLVIALHGRLGNGAGLAYVLDMNRVAREQGFIVVYPDGIQEEWNYARGNPYFQDNGVDDTAFLAALVDDLAHDLSIDRQRVYAFGFSNGGFMVHRLACEAPEQYAAFAAASGTFFPDLIDLCAGQPPVPILIMHGTLDNNVPWDGVTQAGVETALSVPDTVLFWAVQDQCDPQQTDYTILPSSGDSPGTLVYRYTFDGCADGSDVLFYAIEGGGHNLPGVTVGFDPAIAGSINMDIHVSDVVWDFFAQHTRAD